MPGEAKAAKALAKGAAGSIRAAGTIAHNTSASSTYSTHAIEVAPIMPTGMSTEGFFTCTGVILQVSGCDASVLDMMCTCRSECPALGIEGLCKAGEDAHAPHKFAYA